MLSARPGRRNIDFPPPPRFIYRLDDDRNNKNLDGTGDDVFVSLDAFDMLTDFQELDILEHAAQQAPST